MRQLQGKPLKAGCRPPRGLDAANAVHSCFFSEGVFRGYLKSTGNSISKSAVQRYASNLMESLHTLRMAQENFSAIMEETEKYKNVNFTEPLTMLLCSRLLEQINILSDEQIQAIDIETLTKNAVALTRAVAYKRNVDAKTNTMIGNGVEQFNEVFFQSLANDKPKPYKELKNFLKDNFKTS